VSHCYLLVVAAYLNCAYLCVSSVLAHVADVLFCILRPVAIINMSCQQAINPAGLAMVVQAPPKKDAAATKDKSAEEEAAEGKPLAYSLLSHLPECGTGFILGEGELRPFKVGRGERTRLQIHAATPR